MSNQVPDEGAEPDTRRRQIVLIVILSVIYLAGNVDRAIISFLVEPIKQDLRLTDVEISLIAGLAYTLSQTGMNIPAGFLVDRYSRRALIGNAAAGWSFMTMMSGFAASFGQLFGARFMVGIGESFITPCSYSMIKDRVSKRGTGWAYTSLGMATYGGSALALLGGAALLDMAHSGRFSTLPIVGGLTAWRQVMILVGVVSMPVALLLFFVRPDVRSRTGEKAMPFRQQLAETGTFLRSNVAIYSFLIGYMLVSTIHFYNGRIWITAMLSRKLGIPISTLGYTQGMISLSAGVTGTLLCGFVLDRLTVKGRGYIPLAQLGLLATGISTALMAFVDNPTVALTMYGIYCAIGGFSFAIGGVLLSRLTPRRMMGRITSLYLVIPGIGGSLGPTITAAISEHFFTGKSAIANAYSLVALGLTVIGFFVLLGLQWAVARHSTGRDAELEPVAAA